MQRLPELIGFKEWQERQKQWLLSLDEDEKIECPDCNGYGEIEDECSCCGSDYTKDCETCDGDGELYFSELTGQQLSKHFLTAELYKEAVEKDVKDLARCLDLHYDDIAFCYNIKNNHWRK